MAKTVNGKVVVVLLMLSILLFILVFTPIGYALFWVIFKSWVW